MKLESFGRLGDHNYTNFRLWNRNSGAAYRYETRPGGYRE